MVLVLAGFAVISKVFALGGRTPQFELASGVMIVAIWGFLLWRSLGSLITIEASRDGKTLAFVTGLIPCPLTTFIMSYALARGTLAAGLTVTAAMTVGMIVTIGGVALAALSHETAVVGILARTENWRHQAGLALEVGSAAAVIALGALTVLRALQPA